MEINQGKVLFVTREAGLVEDVKERPAPLAYLFPGLLLSEDRMIREVFLEEEGTKENVRRFALSIGPDREITGLREDDGINKSALADPLVGLS